MSVRRHLCPTFKFLVYLYVHECLELYLTPFLSLFIPNPQADRILKYTISGWPNDLDFQTVFRYVFERVVVSILNSDWLQPYRPLWHVSIYLTEIR